MSLTGTHSSPPLRNRRRTLSAALAALLALALLAWALWPVSTLEIRTGKEGQLLRVFPVTPGERIVYEYTHSVQKGRIEEVMEVAPDRLIVRETTYNDFGAGLPSDLPDGTVIFDELTQRYRIVDMSRELPSWPVRVAFTAAQTLQVRGETVRLDSLAAPTTLLVVDVVTGPRVASVLGR